MKRADHFHRYIAKTIDFLIVGVLGYHSWIGVFAGALYIAISDGFFQGQSVGKRVIGLRVMVNDAHGVVRICTFRDSIIRNVLFSIAIVLANIWVIGWFLFLPLGMVFLLIEAYFVYFDDKGVRIGDIFAGSQVIDVDAKATNA